MLKKSIIILIFLFGISFINFTFSELNNDNQSIIDSYNNSLVNDINSEIESKNSNNDPSFIDASQALKGPPTAENANIIDTFQKNVDDKARDKACAANKNCIDKPTFEISVNDISPGMNVIKGSTSKTINFALGTIIQKLMIGLGSLSLLIMTVGAGYIVLHGGQDELLNKGKSIFMSGIYAMLVALSSYYLIVIVRYVLYA